MSDELGKLTDERIDRLREALVATNAMLHNTCTAEASVQAERDEAKAAAERLRDALRELVREADAHLLPYDTAGGKAESGKALYVTSVKAIAEAALAADAAAGGDPPHEPREEA